MKTKINNLPPTCPNCEASKSFVTQESEIEQEYRKETFNISSECTVCSECGFSILADGQSDKLRMKTVDAYRNKHGLLTSFEMVARRKKMVMTQQQFADHVGVGIASIKRWEGGRVQDPSSDALIRIKTEPTGFSYSNLKYNMLLNSDWAASISSKGSYHIGEIGTIISSPSSYSYKVSPKVKNACLAKPAKNTEPKYAFPIAA